MPRELKRLGTKDIYRPIRILAERRSGKPGHDRGPDQPGGARHGVQGIQVIGEISHIVVPVDEPNPKGGVRSARRSRGRTVA